MNGGDMGIYVVSEGSDLDPTLSNPASNLSSNNRISHDRVLDVHQFANVFGAFHRRFPQHGFGRHVGRTRIRDWHVEQHNGALCGGYRQRQYTHRGTASRADHPGSAISLRVRTSITADGQNHDFTVSFSDSGGDINRIVINSVNATWGTIDFNPVGNIKSGDGYSGTTTFAYNCTTGSSSFSDTLQITLYDAAGNTSQPYTHPLACESLEPPKITYAPVISSVQGPSSITANSGQRILPHKFHRRGWRC